MKKYSSIFKACLITWTLFLIATITANAKKLGADYSWGGIQIGVILAIISIIVIVVCLVAVAYGSLDKKFGLIIGIIFFFLLFFGIMLVQVDVDTTTGQVTSNITWDVEIQSASGSNVTYDDDARTITCLCHVNSTAGTILSDSDGTYTNPIINWSVGPSQTTGLTDFSKGATSIVSITNPDYEYTEDGEDYYLIAQSSGGKRDVNFTNDDTSEYESKTVSVQFGSSEYVELYINWYDTGVATLEAGETKSITADICGHTYTIQLIVTGVIT